MSHLNQAAQKFAQVTALNGIRICHRSIGETSKPAVLMIMGHGASMTRWGGLDERIASAGYRVITLDNRGSGLTKDVAGEAKTPDPVPLTMPGANPDNVFAWCVDDMADDAVAVLDHYGIDKAHVVGVSMGGLIAQNVAVRHADRCRTVVPIMTSFDLNGAVATAMQKNPEWWGKLLEAAAGRPAEGMSQQEVLAKSLPIMKLIATDEAFPDWTPRLQGVVEESVAIDYARGGIDWGGKGGARQSLAISAWTASKLAAHKEGLKKLAVPALVLHGRYDPLIPVEAGRALHELIPGARLCEYDGGHNLGNDDTVRGAIEAVIVEHVALH